MDFTTATYINEEVTHVAQDNLSTRRQRISPQNKTRKFQLSEGQLGYVMIAPAIIIICVIALYPVLKSCWYSLFDYRLNNPTKNEIFLTSKLNMEKYYSNIDDAMNTLTNLVDTAKGSNKQNLMKELRLLKTAHEEIISIKNVKAKEKAVRKLTDSYLPVNSDKLRYAQISSKSAKGLYGSFDKLLTELSSMKVGAELQSDLEKTSGLVEELRSSIIEPNFVGIKNYSYYLNPKNSDFWQPIGYTFTFTIISVVIELVIGMLVAIIINRAFRGRGIVRAAVLVPWAIPTVIAAQMWKFLYDGQTGFMAHVFASLHLIKNAGILLTTHGGTTFAVVFADVWKTSPYMALLLLAGLQGIDTSLYEATAVDGANKIQQFFKITLPLLKPTILVALLFRTLDAFRIFDLIMILTGGSNNTETISTYAYKTMFSQMEFGRGSSLAFLVFICVAIISIAYIKLLGANVLSNDR